MPRRAPQVEHERGGQRIDREREDPAQAMADEMHRAACAAAHSSAFVSRAIARSVGAPVLYRIENHHNFAWRERHDGRAEELGEAGHRLQRFPHRPETLAAEDRAGPVRHRDRQGVADERR